MNWETYIAFGDSITIGARTYLGYPELVGHELSIHLSKQWNVINHSVSGFRAIDLARYIDNHFLSLKESRSSVSTILIGTNDIKEQTNLHDFKIVLDQVILKTRLLTLNNNVIIFAIPQFHKGIAYPYSIGMNETIAAFNTVIKELAAQHKIRMLTLIHTKEDFTDGVHLNDHGVITFSDQIINYILKDKGIELPNTSAAYTT
ncbi:MAG: lipolytic protein family [Flavipsychrobacter sp.]|nr:lipolytic protein family [Flavipsychrobacter sp.]